MNLQTKTVKNKGAIAIELLADGEQVGVITYRENEVAIVFFDKWNADKLTPADDSGYDGYIFIK